MASISIFCKSYRPDLARARQMAESLQRHNKDRLALYISVPLDDLTSFKEYFSGLDVHWLADEEIIGSNPSIDLDRYRSLPGHISQQIVKSEFWRVNPVDNYLCIDSDSIFIRDFSEQDFIAPCGTAYTVMHEDKAFLHFCTTRQLSREIAGFREIQKQLQGIFERDGILYNFGPFPVIWNNQVWRDLDTHMLRPQHQSILDAICLAPSEGFWYGEALLKYRSIPVLPREPLFRVYLFLEEYEEDITHGSTYSILAENYLGVVLQSNWYPRRLGKLRNLAYKLKKKLRTTSGS